MSSRSSARSGNPGRRPIPSSRTRAILAGLALAGVLGCSTLPTAPRVGAGGASPGVAVSDRAARGGGTQVLSEILPPDLPSAGADTVTTGDDSTLVALQISGSLGGEVSAGRFEVALPAGAFKGDAMVSIRVDQGNALKCELNISPASANRFEKPVLLTVNCSGALHVERMGIVWLNEATGTWEEVAGGSCDPKAGTVSAPLQHFSTYAVTEVVREGKAGW